MDTNSIPLILPRRHSISGNSNNQRTYQWPYQPYPPLAKGCSGPDFTYNKLATPSANSRPKLSVVGDPLEVTTSAATQTQSRLYPANYSRGRRRHSISSGSPWTTVPPKHALHMPVMKINPEVWRNESRQREINRLLHEGREIEIMRRRNMGSIMDTSDEGEDDTEMKGVVSTIDLGGFKASEEREKRREQEEVKQEWMKALHYTEESGRRKSWPNLLCPQPNVALPLAQQHSGLSTYWNGQQVSNERVYFPTTSSMSVEYSQPRNLRRASFSGF